VNLRGSVHILGHVTSEERTWLLKNTEAVLYPSSAEGFGFVPYEASALGTPTTFPGFGPLQEIAQLIDLPSAWNSQPFAADLANLIANELPHKTRLKQLERTIGELTWNHFGKQLSTVFVQIAGMPRAATATIDANSTAEAAALAQVLSSKSWRLTALVRRITDTRD
jgi:hypothetical protein